MIFGALRAGRVLIEIKDASIADLLSRIHSIGITLYEVAWINDITLNAEIKSKHYDYLYDMVKKHGGMSKIIKKSQLRCIIDQIKRRTIIILGIALLIIAVFYLPTRVLFIQVSGNSAVPEKRILEKAHDCGIYFGSSRKKIRNEKLKNTLLADIPELQWVGVNTDGCIAVISVKEKTDTQKESASLGVSNIVAKRDGIVLSRTVLSGTPVCEVGQAVVSGQILVSGYSDYGICIRATQANAEVLGQTSHLVDIVSPSMATQRGRRCGQTTQYSLLIGKKLIKLNKGSGISDSSCVKIYEQDYLSLPGGFRLPVCLITEHIYDHEISAAECDAETGKFDWLEEYTETYLQNEMVAGRILAANTKLTYNPGYVLFSGRYDCIEMIGQTKAEENIVAYGFGNRKNS